VTATPPQLAALLLKIIEDLCEALSQLTGSGLFGRLVMAPGTIPLRRQLRSMAAVVAEVIAEAAAPAPDTPPIFVASDPATPGDAPPDGTPPEARADPTEDRAQDLPQTTAAGPAPVPPPGPADAALPQDPRAQRPATVPAEPAGDDGKRPASDAAAASMMADAGRRTSLRDQTAPARKQTASTPPPAPMRPPSRRRGLPFRPRSPQKPIATQSPRRILHAHIVPVSKHISSHTGCGGGSRVRCRAATSWSVSRAS